MNFFVRYITGLSLYIRARGIQRHCENEGVDPAARTVARYRRRGVEISLQSDRRVGGRVPSAISMTLHPANVQDAHRTPVPDVSVGRIRVEGDGRTYVYASVRPAGRSNTFSLYCHFICRPLTDQPIAFTFAPAATRARALKSKAFSTSCPPPPPSFPSPYAPATCSVPAATLPVVRARTPRVVHSRCILTVTRASRTLPDAYADRCGHIISTIDAIMTRNSNRTDASSMSPPSSSLKYMARQPRRVIPPAPRFILPAEFRILVVVEPRRRCTNKQTTPSNCLCPGGSIILRNPLVRSGPSSSFWMDPVPISRYLNFSLLTFINFSREF